MPESASPGLCVLADAPPEGDDWLFEPKYDGLRVLVRFDGRRLTMLSRNDQPQEFVFPDITEALRKSLSRPAILDGEVVCFDEQGRTSFRVLQQRFHLKDPGEIRERAKRFPASIFLFDILYLDRFDLRDLPLLERKRALRGAVRLSDRVRWTEFARDDGEARLRRACSAGEEGIIAKHAQGRYTGGRSGAWVKVKCIGRQEFAIGGFTDPQRSRVGLGALLVGYYGDDGETFHYAGKVGTGYTRETLLDLRHRLDGLEQDKSPFADGGPVRGAGVHWVRPRLVAEIGFAEWTQNGLLRQPRFEGLRPDKEPREVRRERAAPPPDVSAPDEQPGTERGDAMPLNEYRAKRNFRQTPEPAAKSERGHKRPIFVVQEHHASRLHYDFRLEADGVLKSWAVPKAPSLDPAHKRLAVHVEDHPLAYASFKGTIPEGQYGAGEVKIWDHGTYENLKGDTQDVSAAIKAGRMEFALDGKKLRGKFALIRMRGGKGKKENWLLIKMRDEYARPDAGDGPAGPKAKAKPKRPVPMKSVPRARKKGEPAPKEVEVTHGDKVMFPEAGITKADLVAYYDRVADHLLPHLRDRPATLERLPDGIGRGKPHFWQKNTPDYYPDWIPRADLPSETGKIVPYVLVNDRATLLYLVNQGTLTFHPWFSRVDSLDRPDYVLFDLDPDGADFADVVAVARKLHEALGEAGVESVVKTSGKRGLHVLAPWTEKGGYDEARDWARTTASRVEEAMPRQVTMEIRKAKRDGRVYIDVLQNARGHHAVPPYVVRAVPEATVSTPLRWDELMPDLDPKRFTVRTVPRRLSGLRRDPMAALTQ